MTETLEDVRDGLIEALGSMLRTLRYRESRTRVGDPARRQLTDRMLREMRDASKELHAADIVLRQHIENEKERR